MGHRLSITDRPTANPPHRRSIAEPRPCGYVNGYEDTNGDHTRNLSGHGVPAMTAHALYVMAAYAVSALAIAGLVAWIFLDQRARRRELAELEASGARRRSDRGGSSE